MISQPSTGSHLRLVILGATKVLLSVAILQTLSPSAFTQQALPFPKSGTRSVVVNVFDIHGKAIRDLTKDNFRVLLNGKPTAVLDAGYSFAPRRMVLLVDMSGSMTGDKTTGKWRIAREAVHDLVAETPSDMPIAMLTFAGKVREAFDFSQGRSAIAKWLSEGSGQEPNLGHPARTALFDSILAGLQLLRPIQPGDALYVITDGGEDASLASAIRTKKALLQSGVRMFTLLFAEPQKVSEEQEAEGSFLSMVQDSGGFAFGLSGHLRVGQAPWESDHTYQDDSRDKIKLYTQQLTIQVNGFWTLEVAAPLSSNGESKIKLEVVSNEGRVRKDVGVTYYRVLPSVRYLLSRE
jgi:hypothetical protein